MDKKLLSTLKELGLSHNEALVYLASLALGSTTISKIASAAQVKRTSVYPLIESLKQKGLINIEIKGFKKLFVPESPAKLEIMLELRRQKLNNNLPSLLSLYNTEANDSFIKCYEGLAGMKTVYNGILQELKHHDDYLAVSDTEQFQNLDRSYFADFIKKRTRLQLKTRLLLQNTTLAKERKKFARNFNEQIKILPPATTLTTNLVIIPNRVIIHQLVPPIMITVIENKNIIKMHQEMFEIMWRSIRT